MLLFFWTGYLLILFNLSRCFSLLEHQNFVVKLDLFDLLVFELNLPCELSFIFVLIAHLLDSLTHLFVLFTRDFFFFFNIDKCHVHYHCFLLFWLLGISVLTYLLVDEHWELLWYFLEFFSDFIVFFSERSKLIDRYDESFATFRSNFLRVSSILQLQSWTWRRTLLLINLMLITQILFHWTVVWSSVSSVTIRLLKTVNWLNFWFWDCDCMFDLFCLHPCLKGLAILLEIVF